MHGWAETWRPEQLRIASWIGLLDEESGPRSFVLTTSLVSSTCLKATRTQPHTT